MSIQTRESGRGVPSIEASTATRPPEAKRRWLAGLVVAAAVTAFVQPAGATPITYTGTLFNASGSLGSVHFDNATVEVTFLADTSTAIPYGPSPAPVFDQGYENLAGFASVRILDGATLLARADVLSQARLFVGVDNSVGGLALGSAGVPPDDPAFPGLVGYPIGMQVFGDSALDTYDLTSNLEEDAYHEIVVGFSCVGEPLFDSCAAPVAIPTTLGELLVDPMLEDIENRSGPAKFVAKTGSGAGVGPHQFVFAGAVGDAPPATAASAFNVPMGMTMSVASNPGSLAVTIYVADPFNDRIVAFNPDGSTSTFSALTCPSSLFACPSSTWMLSEPTFVAAAPDGNVWISDTGNDVVVEMDTSGTVVRFAGRGPDTTVYGCTGGCGSPPHPNAGDGQGQFFGPGPLAVDELTGDLFVADWAGSALIDEDISGHTSNLRIQKFTSSGSFQTAWGSWCSLGLDGSAIAGNCDTNAPGAQALGDGEFGQVTGLAVDNAGHVYTVDQGLLTRVQKFDGDGTFLLKWVVSSAGGIAVDLDQSVYVAESGDHRVEQFDGMGALRSRGGSRGAGQVQFDGPFGIAAVPPAAAFFCLLGADTDCVHGFAVSERGNQHRIQLLAARPDADNDGITDELDLAPQNYSNDFSNASLGFTTTGKIIDRGDVSAVVHAVETPASDDVRLRTDTFGGPKPLAFSFCSPSIEATLPPGDEAVIHCSTPTISAELGPFSVRFTGADGTVSTATLETGASLSLDVTASALVVNAGTIAVNVGGVAASLTPGQTLPVLTPVANPAATPVSGAAPLAVEFQANASDARNDSLTYRWDFGDPASNDDTSTAANPTHVYAAPGNYNVGLTVSNGAVSVTRALGVTVLTPTSIAYGGATSGECGDPITVSAALSGAGVPLAGESLTFTAGAQSCSGVTDASGVGSCELVMPAAGPAPLSVNYAGSDGFGGSSLASSVAIVLDGTTLRYTGASFLADGAGASLSANLTEEDGSVIAGAPVTLALGCAGSVQSCTGVTDVQGTATCVVPRVSQPLGPLGVVASFAGDTCRKAGSVTANVVVYANLAAGAFVVGDKTDSGTVTFWSPQWSATNALSGGPAPAQFKGFAGQVTTPPRCGTSWTSLGGSAAGPPATVPAYLGVLVTSSITGKGPLLGNTQGVAVVHVDPGYGPGPGHRGTGTVLGVVCP